MNQRGPGVSRHLLTSEPLPQSQQGYIRRQRAMVCAEEDCGVIFTAGPCCPNCASEHMTPLSLWLDQSREARRLGDRPRRYFEDGSGYEIDPKENRA